MQDVSDASTQALPINQRRLANAIRVLAMDAVQKANSGHPGAPMGMADIAEVVWRKYLKHNPANPKWANRDRFVLSNGHGSMLIYALLHLTGYELSIEDLKNFRQLHSKTPGHPELGYTPGVETTTGPLGQGIANAVGFAIAEKTLAAQFNTADFEVIDHNTFCFLGDGCLMEGISHEVCSLAGTLKLGKLVAFYDDNGISIDGEVEGWFSDDTAARFESYGWHVQKIDGHSAKQIDAATEQALQISDKPSLIMCRTLIGAGSPNKQGSESSHGAPLGDDEITLTRDSIAWADEPFVIPEDIYEAWDAKVKGDVLEKNWDAEFAAYAAAEPEKAAELKRRLSGDLPSDFASEADAYIAQVQSDAPTIATRKASQNAITEFAPKLPQLLGGSADLAGSNLTLWPGAVGIQDDAAGNYVYYGVREFGMTGIANGIALHGGFIPYVATFLVFMEYAHNAVRMSALMRQHVIHVYTHDSIGLGEDGPTHQPIEQITALRLIPNLHTWRPCDATEAAVAWKCALVDQSRPHALIFSRQGLKVQARSAEQVAQIERGGYVLVEPNDIAVGIILATGSEVQLAVDAAAKLADSGVHVRVVSMPCTEKFLEQSSDYRESVLPSSLRVRVAVEAAETAYWYRFVGLDGAVVGMTTFGESAPAADLFEYFGITADAVVEAIKAQL